MKKTAIILNNGVEETEAIATIDLLRRAKIEVDLFSTDSLDIVGSHDIKFRAQKELSKLKIVDYDGLIIPGGPGTKDLINNEIVLKLVKEFHEENKLVAAICAAPQILGKAGILNGVSVTHYPGANEFLKEANDKSPKQVVVDGHIITSVGVGAVFDFGLALIQYLENDETAQKIKTEIVYDY
ncbi:4-methyl-5(b-hydroxyethyl)-thiazole monophosphate biosynthesis [Entomoplasma freundtii]|uniref:4-methyl-5(B-hydroxyethyl)-thiazole monophosphate biosynthesis n=1 Tax=Entomoplasma freundtii TaxID=74700 RepID=A0A2K8NRE6_9MOLU|nr:DJ-1 family glyoxalase III [Entomoplasma freundtii]ATZ16389.1 4-methyl-5(b-hydroxyethyl)-thiazole monophosphate biosynthesis [Entomoplasma freundtii]TDY56572.1 4-methyl-5(b-hydroxyethyl)-thiazole monophosphate biosynthesis [Entomoplasma freundtii]